MTPCQACEAVVGRLLGIGRGIVLVVDDGADRPKCWIDPEPGSFPIPSCGRCAGGRNNETGRVHRGVWADPATRITGISGGHNNFLR
jgi:hypothetical protein